MTKITMSETAICKAIKKFFIKLSSPHRGEEKDEGDSLLSHPLTLTLSPMGRGKMFKFTADYWNLEFSESITGE
jgi:hypothetical protein